MPEFQTHPDSDDDLPDGDLLRRFIQDADQHAFAAIVRRYQGLVLTVCLRVIGNESDADDAFQATFISLARRPRQVQKSESVSSWLYTVAWRTSWKIVRTRRALRTESLPQRPLTTMDDPLERISSAEECLVLDEELNRLPERYREVLVMTYFADQTSQQIADQLNVSKGTVDGRIWDARNRLRVRLARRGVSVGVLAIAAGTNVEGQTMATTTLLESTIQLSSQTLGGSVPGTIDLSHIEPFIHSERAIMTTKTLITGLLCTAVIFGVAGMKALVQTADSSGPTDQLQTEVGNSDGDSAEREAKSAVVSAPQTATPKQISGMPTSPVAQVALDSGAGSLPRFATYAPSSSPIEIWMHNLMDKPAPPLKFKETTSLSRLLEQIAEHASEQHGSDAADAFRLTIVPDFLELELASIKSLEDVQIKEFNFSGGSIRSALHLIFSQTDPGLTSVIQDDVLVITSEEKVQQIMNTRVYDVGPFSKMQFVGDVLISYKDFQGGMTGGFRRSVATSKLLTQQSSERKSESKAGLVDVESDSNSVVPGLTLVDLVQTMTSPDSWSSSGADPGGQALISGDKLIVRQTYLGHQEIVELLNMLFETHPTK